MLEGINIATAFPINIKANPQAYILNQAYIQSVSVYIATQLHIHCLFT